MHSRKLHVDGEDPQRLYRALRQLYEEGVRIPFGKPYSLRKNSRTTAGRTPDSVEMDCDIGGLTLAPEDDKAPPGHNPYDEA